LQVKQRHIAIAKRDTDSTKKNDLHENELVQLDKTLIYEDAKNEGEYVSANYFRKRSVRKHAMRTASTTLKTREASESGAN
jgi:hypothetical protein